MLERVGPLWRLAGCALLVLGMIVVLLTGALSAPPYSLIQLLVTALVAALIVIGGINRPVLAIGAGIAAAGVASGAFLSFLLVGKTFDLNATETWTACAWAMAMFLFLGLCFAVGLLLWARHDTGRRSAVE